jgi:alpha-mannosidase
MPGACKNWFTVQRWVDISNRDYGVTWATVDAPLVEVGAITAELPWMEHIEPSPTLYSYVMNNYWHTNYRAEQEGPTTFRYSLQPHRSYSPELAARFGAEASQPLLVAPAGASPVTQPRLRVEPAEAMVAAFKPSDDGRAWIVRLFNASDAPVTTKVHWGELQPQAVWLSGVNEKPRHQVTGGVHLPAYGLVTLRADLP